VTDPGQSPRLLLAEDDEELRSLLADVFVAEGYRVEAVADGGQALDRGLERVHDVIVIDRRMPRVEGLDVVTGWRRQGVATPVLVLTASSSVDDRVQGLDAGADDYLVKPFEIPELLARVRSLVRRHDVVAESLTLGEARLDPASRVVLSADGTQIAQLSAREAALVQVLAASPRQVFSRDQLLASVFDEARGAATVDTYVHYVRRKLGAEAVLTVQGVGYRWGRA
jgi:two-component system, OmpR family, response regulator QseB